MWIVVACLMAGHLLLVNVASGAPLVCMWLEFRAKNGCEAAESARWMLAKHSFYALLAGGVIGTVALILLWDPALSVAFKALSKKVMYGGIEYLFSLVLMGVYVFAWRTAPKTTGSAAFRAFILLLAGTNLLYHFPFLFLILSGVANGALEVGDTVTAADFRGLMIEGDILPRALHFIVACFAVTGVWLFWNADRGAKDEHRDHWVRWGGSLALTPTMLQILIGFWIIMKLPSPAVKSLMGRDMITTILLVLSVLLAFWLMHLFSMIALGKSDKRGRTKAAVVLVAVIVLMCGVVQRMQATVRAANTPAATQRLAPTVSSQVSASMPTLDKDRSASWSPA